MLRNGERAAHVAYSHFECNLKVSFTREYKYISQLQISMAEDAVTAFIPIVTETSVPLTDNFLQQ